MSQHEVFMKRAIGLARQGMAGGHGGPFGAVVVRDGEIIGEGHNRVLSAVDPTAHAEVTAIRDAARKEERFDLSGAEIYVNGLPCPMCMSAIFWARIGKVYYACAPEDAEKIGFDDQKFYRQLAKPPAERTTPAIQLTEFVDEARETYNDWLRLETRTAY
ncbi:MAG: nucleoside deaminase [Rhodospirillales bacterium]|nr:nucleoside deaminase [Rhodospirillales bacterium]